MAVSMNAGFMRSDYMISDAALPLRMEELEQLEQTAKFSEILGDIGNASMKSEAPVENAQQTVETSEALTEATGEADGETAVPMLSKTELKQLAKAVVRGEVKLDEIPQEHITDVLLMVIAMMMLGIPEDEIPALEDYSVHEVRPVELETAEAFLNVVEDNKNIQLVMNIVNDQPESVIPEELKQEFSRQVEMVAFAADEVAETIQIADVKSETNEVEAKEIPAGVEATASATEQAVTASAYRSNNSSERPAESAVKQNVNVVTADQELTEEFEQLRKVITEFTVKKTVAEQPQQQSNAVQTMAADSNVKSRVVSKSEELEILKSAAKPTETVVPMQTAEAQTAENGSAEMQFSANAQTQSESNAPVQQETDSTDAVVAEQLLQSAVPEAANEAPVVFVRNDGTQFEVRPREMITQITSKVVEQTTTAEGDTEYSLTLDPEDLGSITVRLTKTVDGSLSVSIMAQNARTQRIIEQNSAVLQSSLRESGIELENWQTVGEAQQENRAEDYNGSSKNPYYHEETANAETDDEDNTFAELISAM